MKSTKKKNVIVPIFVSHMGCPNDCVFCNQRKIAKEWEPFDEVKLRLYIETYINSVKDKMNTNIDIAFYGGSFTGIEKEIQNKYLCLAQEYVDRGLLRGIRMSTRPDYINESILNNLKKYTINLIEFGVQSFDNEVLMISERGHTANDVYVAVKLIKEYKLNFGIQLMIGLPTDTLFKSVESAKKAAALKPSTIRIYPTLVIKDTKLEEMFNKGIYKALSIENAVNIAAEMYKIFTSNNINVIRMGLQPTDNITSGGDVVSGPFHSSFRHLVESKLILEKIVIELKGLNTEKKTLKIKASNKKISEIVGIKKSNIKFLKEHYNFVKIFYEINNDLQDNFTIEIMDG
ncbi:elongator complex protein 3 [Helicovermis profundi]|uniref:Radical SAM protein n=1 Tax=Helicovermis profundi TaxID=3065157 RepID=A0AAU9EWD5_9FIRM|nr:radical SAM protein [Clostridia bacterium S502]